MKPTRPTILFALMLISSSCALKPISSEHALLRMEKEDISSESLGKGKVLIYNDANILHTGDNTARLNIVLDDKNLGQLKAKDFVKKSNQHLYMGAWYRFENMERHNSKDKTPKTKFLRQNSKDEIPKTKFQRRNSKDEIPKTKL